MGSEFCRIQTLLLLQVQHIVEEIISLLFRFFLPQLNTPPHNVEKEVLCFFGEKGNAVEPPNWWPKID